MNLNELAKEISKLEGGKKELSIGQIKEVVKCISILIYEDTLFEEHDNMYLSDLVIKLYKNGKKWARK